MSSRGAFFGRIDDPRSQKNNNNTGDNGDERRLAVTKVRRTNAPEHSEVSALCLVEGLLARCGENSDKEVASSLRSQSPLFSQGRGADSLEETPGRAGVSRGDEF